MCQRFPVQCIIPPYMTEQLARSDDARVRDRAEANLAAAALTRNERERNQAIPSLLLHKSPSGGKHRLLYDAKRADKLPGKLVRSEGEPDSGDIAVTEAYDHAGSTYDFYEAVFKRNSLDDKGMTLIGSVHLDERDDQGKLVALDNAFWNGKQMAYGDGDDLIFQRFTRSLDVVGHELTHGVQSFTSNLEYQGQSGALNEHFADVFGILVRQWKLGETERSATWLIGREVLVTAPTRRGVRDMEHPGTAYMSDPYLGTDPQPAHVRNLYEGSSDNGGVHINSGIPNRAFVLAAKALGGNPWDTAGRIWYDTMLRISKSADFQECAELCAQNAAQHGASAVEAVRHAWANVGVNAKKVRVLA